MKTRTLFLGIFGSQFLNYLLSFSLLTYFSFNSKSIDQIAFSVGLFSVGSVLALIISKAVKRHRAAALYVLMILALINSLFVISLKPEINLITGSAIVLVAASLGWCYSILSAQAATLEGATAISSKLQFYSTLAILLGVTLGPLLSSYLSFSNLWCAEALGLAIQIAFVAGWLSTYTKPSPSPDSPHVYRVDGELPTLTSVSQAEFWNYRFYPLAALAIVWLATGFFQVFEVKILIERFSLNQTSISIVFGLTLAANLMSTRFVAPKLKNVTLSAALNGLTIMAACLGYLITRQRFFVFFLIGVIGLTNGLFNVAYVSLIMKNSCVSKREDTFLNARMISQFALLASASLASYLDVFHVSLVLLGLIAVMGALSTTFLVKWKPLRATALCFAFVVLFIGSHSTMANTQASELTILIPELPKSLDPRQISDTTSALIASQIFDQLYRYDENNFLSPALAENVLWSQDQKSLELKLKQGLHFSNGIELTAGHVRDSILEIVRFQKAKIKWALGEIEGFPKAIQTGNLNSLGITVLDSRRIRFSFSRPNPLFIHFLASPSLPVFLYDSSNQTFFGTGHYIFKSKNSREWVIRSNNQPASYQRIAFVSPQSKVPFQLSSYLPEDSEIPHDGFVLERHSFPLLQMVVMVFNSRDHLLKDPKLRCSLAGLFQQTLSDKSFYEWQPISLSLPFSWDIAKVQSGYRFTSASTDHPLRFQVLFANSAAHFNSVINQKASGEFRRKGIDIHFEKTSIQNLISKFRAHDFQIGLFGYVPDYPHLDAVLAPFIGSDQEYNFSTFSSKKVDALLTAAREAINHDSQNKTYSKIFDILSTTCPVGILGTQQGTALVGKGIQIPKFSSLGFHTIDLSKVRKK